MESHFCLEIMNFDSTTNSKFINNLLFLISIITKIKDKLLHYNVIKCYHLEKLGKYYTGFLLVLKIVREFIILKIKKVELKKL